MKSGSAKHIELLAADLAWTLEPIRKNLPTAVARGAEVILVFISADDDACGIYWMKREQAIYLYQTLMPEATRAMARSHEPPVPGSMLVLLADAAKVYIFEEEIQPELVLN